MLFYSYPLELISTYPGSVLCRCARIAETDSPIVDALAPAAATTLLRPSLSCWDDDLLLSTSSLLLFRTVELHRSSAAGGNRRPDAASPSTSSPPSTSSSPLRTTLVALLVAKQSSRPLLSPLPVLALAVDDVPPSRICRTLPHLRHFRHSVGLMRLQLVHVHCNTEAIVPIVRLMRHHQQHGR